MKYTVQIFKSALKALQKLPGNIASAVEKEIDALADNPRPIGCKKLSGIARDKNLFRIRKGDYCVIYQIKDDVLLVLIIKIAHRCEVYRGI